MTKATLQDVFDEVQSHPDRWPASTYPKILDALRRLSRLMNQKLEDLPACPSGIDGLINQNLNWRTAGFSTESAFRDFKGKIKRAIRQTRVGRGGIPTRTRTIDLSPTWQVLLEDIGGAVARNDASPWIRRSIAHLAGYANSIGKDPRDVNDDLANDLMKQHAGMVGGKSGCERARASVRTWNKLIGLKATGVLWLCNFPDRLAPLSLESRRKRINPPDDTWPESLRADVEGLLAKRRDFQPPSSLVGPERFAILLSSRSPTRPAESGRGRWRRRGSGPSAAARRQDMVVLRQAVGALVRAGTPLASITSLNDVLNPRAIATSLLDYESRLHPDIAQCNRPSSQWQLACELSRFLQLWGDPSAEELAMLSDLRAACLTDSCGTMAVSRKKLLWQFDTPANLLAWFNRPDELVKRAEAKRRRGSIDLHDIADIETAILCRLVSVLPARRANLCTIRINGDDRHLVLSRHPGESSWIVWPANEVKNKRVLRAEIDERTAALIRLYLDHYRPAYLERTKTPDSPALFPGGISDRYGTGHRDITALGRNFTSRLKEVGLTMTLHLGRHLAARIVLDVDPNMMSIVADLLGDRISTVREYYVDGQTARASAAYRKVLEDKARELRLNWEMQPRGENLNG